MRRREFLGVLGGAVAWPEVARAQRPALPVIGFLHQGTPEPYAHLMAAFQKGLNEVGYVEGRNVSIEYSWARAQYDQLPMLAADLVRRKVNVIATAGGPAAVRAAKEATTTIPIVFSLGADPVQLGLVASLNRPGGNITGVSFLSTELQAKQLDLLRELVPSAEVIAYLVNPRNQIGAEVDTQSAKTAARALGRQIHILTASSENEFETAFAALGRLRAGALLVNIDPLFINGREQLTTLAARYTVPTIYGLREFAVAGGLMSYAASLADTYRQEGVYVGRVLKGEKPENLPVAQPTRFELVINLKVAKALGITIPLALLGRADEVIE